jgi:NADP-dependent 3-hydroxy acid dehydrogenase YdfG
MQNLPGKIALVTGAASGIGLGISRACIAAGMKVVMADKRADVLRAVVADLNASGANVQAEPFDVTNRDEWSAVVERLAATLGEVDLLCSNAGVNIVGPVAQATYADWDFVLGVNIGGSVNAIQTVVPRMVARRQGGHIVITSSVAGLYATPFAAVYSTAKYALVGLAESLRADLKPHGIGVSALCPGPVQSDLFESTVRVRPDHLSATGSISVVPEGADRTESPIYSTAPAGDEIGRRVIDGVQRNALYILTHPEIRPVLEARAQALLDALTGEHVSAERIAASAPLLDPSLYQDRS